MIIPVILAGGAGTRLWPQSRALLPKQFIPFPGQERSLFQETLFRLLGLPDLGAPIVVCNSDHRFLVAEQMLRLGIENSSIYLEPVGRNTAPAAAIAALHVEASEPEAVMLVLPADHLIRNWQALHTAILNGKTIAQMDRLVTFGIVPGAPETGYGYVRKGSKFDTIDAYAVDRFVEKPDLATAKSYLESGEYLWNSGMFMFRPGIFLQELGKYQEEMLQSCRDIFSNVQLDSDYVRLPKELLAACPADSIDYAVMEPTDRAVVLPLDAGWSDLGAWAAVWETADKDLKGNAVSGDVLLEGSENCYIQASSRLVAAVGLKDAVIVETSDAVLVANREQSQNVKSIVESLKASARHEYQHHDLVFRPWGSYRSLENASGYQVKHIVVKPGAALSLQMHHHRAEHWTIIRGSARVTRDDQVHELGPNESIFLPLGCRHRLENPGTEPIELIEVQIGDYLGEDDIVRFEDVYGRLAEDQQ